MLALSPLFAGGFGWNLEEPTPLQLEDCNFLYSDECCSQLNIIDHNSSTGNTVDIDAANLCHRRDDHAANVPPLVSDSPPLVGTAVEARSGNNLVGSDQSSQQLFSTGADEKPLAVVKKLNHNASERDRRRKISDLYSSLRSLLPPSHHSKKLSIPNTVSKVLKYIPELQKEVEELIRKKDGLLSRTNNSTTQTKKPENLGFQGNGTDSPALTQQASTSLSSVQATQISSAEVMIQISTVKLMGQTVIPFSEVLQEIEEEDGLSVVDVSHFESFGGRVFYSIHLLVEGGIPIKCDVLNQKLLSSYKRWEKSCRWIT